jgi:hypothetical protein
MTPEQAKKLINELAPTTTERGEWTEKYILTALTSDLQDYIGAAEIVELFSTFHKLTKHAPELATDLVEVLAGMSEAVNDD